MKKLLIGLLALGSISSYASGGTYDVLKFYLSQSEIQNELNISNDMGNCEVSSPAVSELYSYGKVTDGGYSFTVTCKYFAKSLEYVVEKKVVTESKETTFSLKKAIIKY